MAKRQTARELRKEAAVKRPSVPWGRKAPGTEHNGVSHCAYTVPEAMTDTTEERRVSQKGRKALWRAMSLEDSALDDARMSSLELEL